ncbi:hypothetical protein [Herminiimonas aquatilis]|uniref:Uncharacterized protein n=1 Tax=Herminiimonas aquatilis TaxID=345342 RepID=A0ABW2J0N2_9BURK
MIEATTFFNILDNIKQKPKRIFTLDSAHPSAGELMQRLNERDEKSFIGILFANPHIPYVRNEILSSLEYFHHRSGGNFDFYCCGYGAYWPENQYSDQKIVTSVDGVDWFFSQQSFAEVVTSFEECTKWKYSGETELLLLDVNKSKTTKTKPVIDSAVILNLELMQQDKAITSARSLFEKIIRFAKDKDGRGAFEFSDAAGIDSAKQTIKTAILGLLPSTVASGYLKTENFAVREI